MKILVGKTFGIGNAVLTIPLLKALKSMGHDVDVLVGTSDDDVGAADVMRRLKPSVINDVWFDRAPMDYDIAIMSIPFDGRWQNGTHFGAGEVWDGQRRPGNVDRLGFDMWSKHEVEYQMDNARQMGYDGPTPDCSFLSRGVRDPDLIYVGLGYKRDPGGFGLSKHFGNGRYAALIEEIRRIRPQAKFVSTGILVDMMQSWVPIVRDIGPAYSGFYRFATGGLDQAFDIISRCSGYLGNDTGMMHVAASTDMPTMGMFAYQGLLTKNPPFCARSRSILFVPECPPIEQIARDFVELVWG